MPEVAVVCDDVWKSYRLYHQRSHTLKEKILSRRNRYEEFWALKGIDLEVPVGTALGIVGSNGSGKSTLLKTMARILTADRGTVHVNGRMSSLLELGTGFHPELTGRENVYLGGSLLGLSRRDMAVRYDEVVGFAGVEEFIDMPVKNYSSGMYARLAFAVAISVDPEILLIDEVLSVGDERFQIRCFERIAELREEGRTIVLVSHSLDSVRSLCATAVWLEHGEMRGQGRAYDVVAEYLAEVHGNRASDVPVSGHRYGSQEAEIVDVSFVGADGKGKGSFRTGDPVTVRVRYRAGTPLEGVACGVAVHRAETLAHVFGQNTSEVGLALSLSGEGTVELSVPSLPLLAGQYLVTVALHDETVRKVYDWHERRYSFLVFENPSLPREAGMVHMETRWRVSPVQGSGQVAV